MLYLSTSGTVSILFTQCAVLGCQQQMALIFTLALPLLCFSFTVVTLRATLYVWPISQQAAGHRWTPTTGLIRQTGQTGQVARAESGAVGLQEQKGDFLK